MNNRKEVGWLRKVSIKPIQSIEKALQILNLFTLEKPSWSMTEIMEATQLPRTTAYRILYTLERGGVIHYDQQKLVYQLGLKTMEWGGVCRASFSIREVLKPWLDQLSNETSHTVLVGVLQNDHLLYIDKRERTEGLKVSSEIGRLRPPHYGILGKLLLSFQPVEVVKQLLKRHPLQAYTPKSITDPEKLLNVLASVRERGYLIAEEETITGVSGVAVPLRGHGGQVVAGLAVLVPSFQFQTEKEKLVSLLLQIGAEISTALGYSQ